MFEKPPAGLTHFLGLSVVEQRRMLDTLRHTPENLAQLVNGFLGFLYGYRFGYADSPCFLLTDDDLDVIAGKRDQLIGTIQERYGKGREEVEKEGDAYERRHAATDVGP